MVLVIVLLSAACTTLLLRELCWSTEIAAIPPETVTTSNEATESYHLPKKAIIWVHGEYLKCLLKSLYYRYHYCGKAETWPSLVKVKCDGQRIFQISKAILPT